MWADKVLENVRAAREAHAARFGFDLRAIAEDLQARERTSGRRVVQPPAPEDPVVDASNPGPSPTTAVPETAGAS